MVDSPVGLCAWILEKVWTWSDHEGDLWEVLSPDQVLDNITLYWLTRTGASSARLYWESIEEVTTWFTRPSGDRVTVPTECRLPTGGASSLRAEPDSRRSSTGVSPGEAVLRHWEQPGLFMEVRAGAALGIGGERSASSSVDTSGWHRHTHRDHVTTTLSAPQPPSEGMA